MENGRLKPVLLLGDISNTGIYQYLIKNQVELPVTGRSIFRLSFADFYGYDGVNGKYIWSK